MQWSKTKSRIEKLICNSLQNRVKIYATTYRTNDPKKEQKRIWITLDGIEIFNASTANFLKAHDELWGQIRKKSDEPYPLCLHRCFPQYVGIVSDEDFSSYVLENKNIFSVERIYAGIESYLSLPILEAVNSSDVFIRSLSLFDRRVGKRTLTALTINSDTHPLIKKFYQIRYSVENTK